MLRHKRLGGRWQIILVVLGVSMIWMTLDYFQAIQPLKNLTMDFRYNYRGPVESKQRIVYVNRDTASTQRFGQYLFPRRVYAAALEAIKGIGNADAVFLDIVLSDVSFKSESLDQEKMRSNTENLANAVYRFPDDIILATVFSESVEPWMKESAGELNSLEQFLEKEPGTAYNPRLNPLPELPEFPLWDPGILGNPYGRLGMINTAPQASGDSVVRYMPAFAEINPRLYSLWMARQYLEMKESGVVPPSTKVEDSMDPDVMEIRKKQDPDTGNTIAYEIYDHDWDAVLKTFSVPKEEITIYTAAIQTLAATLDNSRIERNDHEIIIFEGDTARFRVPLVQGKLVELNWFTPWLSESAFIQVQNYNFMADPYNPMMSLGKLYDFILRHQQLMQSNSREDREELNNLENTLRSYFENAIVIIGPTDPILQDVGPTPFESGSIPRVSAHGNLIKTIFHGRFIDRLPFWLEGLLCVTVSVIICLLAITGGPQARLGKLVSIMTIVAYVYLSLYLFDYYDLVIPLVTPVGSAISGSLIVVGFQLLAEEKQKGRIKNLFGTYLSPELVHRMVESGEEPQLGGHTEKITAFFSDIQSFSSFSEVLSPEDLVELMNEYLDAMTSIIENEGGTLDKYNGDAIIAIFGAPVNLENHAYLACSAAQKIHKKQHELCEKWRGEGNRWPELVCRMRTRIGLNSGEATVGNMGSSKRFNYTMMGDMVNLAARNESGAKSYGVYTMVTEDTMEKARQSGNDFVFRYLDKIVVKGRSEPVAVYEIFGMRENISPNEETCLKLFHEGIEQYLNRNWEEAMEKFREADSLEPRHPDREPGVPTTPSRVMFERCQIFLNSPPPENWDGRYIMTTK